MVPAFWEEEEAKTTVDGESSQKPFSWVERSKRFDGPQLKMQGFSTQNNNLVQKLQISKLSIINKQA